MDAATFIPNWADAIAQMEGFNAGGARPARNHNPGDLKFAGQPGAIGKDAQGFAIFPDDATGFQALYNQLTKYVRDFPSDSLLDITAHYLGQHAPEVDSQGNAFQYAAFVAGQLGVPATATLAQLATWADPGAADPGAVVADNGSGEVVDPSSDASAPGQGNGGQIVGMIVGGLVIVWLINRVFGG